MAAIRPPALGYRMWAPAPNAALLPRLLKIMKMGENHGRQQFKRLRLVSGLATELGKRQAIVRRVYSKLVRRPFLKQTIKRARADRERLSDLRSVGLHRGASINRLLRHRVNRLAVADTWLKAVVFVCYWPVAVAVTYSSYVVFEISCLRLGCFVSACNLAVGWAARIDGTILALPMALIVAVVYLLLETGKRSVSLLGRDFSVQFTSASLLAWLITAASVCGAYAYEIAFIPSKSMLNVWQSGWLVGLLGAISVSATVLVMVLYVSTPIAIISRLRSLLVPDLIIADGFLWMLSTMDRHPERWSELGHRRDLVCKLEEVARCIQYDLFQRLRPKDLASDDWMKVTTEQMAAGVRSLKRWILTPTPGTRENLIECLWTYVVAAADGTWDSFPRISAESPTVSQIWGAYLLTPLRVIVVAVLPIVVLKSFQWMHWGAAGGAFPAYVPLLCYAWALLTFLTALDPLLSSKIAAFKAAREIVLPWAAKEGK